jgi:hypothetical protein
MITKVGSVTFHSDGIKVEGFQYANTANFEEAEVETLQWVLLQLKKYRDAKLKRLGSRLVLPS